MFGMDGRLNIQIASAADGGTSKYVADDPQTTTTCSTTATLCEEEARTRAYVKELVFGEFGDIMPAVVGGGSTTYWADYHYTNIPASNRFFVVSCSAVLRLTVRVRASALRIRQRPLEYGCEHRLSPLLYTQFINNFNNR